MATKKQNKRAITMVITLCALVVLFIVYKMAVSINEAKLREEENAAAEKEASLIIADYDYTDTVALSYTQKGGTSVEVGLQGSLFTYTADPSLPLDQTKIAYMAKALSSIGAMAEVNLEGADTDAFGLAEPEWTFSISYQEDDGTTDTHIYKQGAYNSFSEGYYFQEEGDDRVFLVVEGLTEYFEYELSALVDAGTFPVISADTFDSVDITVGDETRHITGEDIADAFVTLCDTLQPSDYADHRTDDGTLLKYGLTNPATTVKVNYTETITVTDTAGASSDSTVEQTRSFTLSLGDEYTVDNKTYRAYLVDGYTFIYGMPTATAESMLSYFTADLTEE